MSQTTKIEWCDATFNPWAGCTKVGPGCDNCYAEAMMDIRYGRANWGAGNARSRTSAGNWKLPLRWNKQPFYECQLCGWRGDDSMLRDNVERVLSSIDGNQAACPGCNLPGLTHARRRVFCASLADWLDNEVPVEWLMDLLDLIRRTPNLDWLLLTKRIGNWRSRLENAHAYAYHGTDDGDSETFDWVDSWLNGKPPANVWLGATIVNQQEADRDIPKLLTTPSAVRFLSIEPLLGAVDLCRVVLPSGSGRRWIDCLHDWYPTPEASTKIDWVIVGGESGPKARPMHPDWVRSLRDQCLAADTPFFFKQWGEYGPNWLNDDTGEKIEGSEWVERLGKKRTGRLLDGKEWNQTPEPRLP